MTGVNISNAPLNIGGDTISGTSGSSGSVTININPYTSLPDSLNISLISGNSLSGSSGSGGGLTIAPVSGYPFLFVKVNNINTNAGSNNASGSSSGSVTLTNVIVTGLINTTATTSVNSAGNTGGAVTLKWVNLTRLPIMTGGSSLTSTGGNGGALSITQSILPNGENTNITEINNGGEPFSGFAGNGGAITLISQNVNDISTFAGIGGTGGNAGAVTLTNCVVNGIINTSARGLYANGRNGGAITTTDTRLTYSPITNGGNGLAGAGGTSGAITMTNPILPNGFNVTTQGGSSLSAAGGASGAITINKLRDDGITFYNIISNSGTGNTTIPTSGAITINNITVTGIVDSHGTNGITGGGTGGAQTYNGVNLTNAPIIYGGNTTSGTAGNGGALTVMNSTIPGNILTSGGISLVAAGGTGGAVTFTNQIFNYNIITTGGTGNTTGANGGAITLTNSAVQNIIAKGADSSATGTTGGSGGIGGAVIMTNSTADIVTNNGGLGIGNFAGTAGGAVTLTNSNLNKIINYGSDAPVASTNKAGGAAGTIIVNNFIVPSLSTFSPNLIASWGGNSTGTGISGAGSTITINALTINLTNSVINNSYGIPVSGSNGTTASLTLNATNLYDTNAVYAPNFILKIGKPNIALVEYPLKFTSALSNLSDIKIANNNVSLNAAINPLLNITSQITYYNLPMGAYSNILKNGANCTDCLVLTAFSGYSIKINVTSFSDYAINGTALINISYPRAITYGQLINVSNLNYIALSPNPGQYCWYSLNGTTNSSAIPCNSANFTVTNAVNGSNTWFVYMNDSTGMQSSANVTFTKNTATNLITNCGYLNEEGGNYSLQNAVINASHCFNINASNIIFNCNGNLITETSSSYAFYKTLSTANTYTIKNCIFNGTSTGGFFKESGSGNNNINLINNTIYISSGASYEYPMQFEEGTNLSITDNIFYSPSPALSNIFVVGNTVVNNVLIQNNVFNVNLGGAIYAKLINAVINNNTFTTVGLSGDGQLALQFSATNSLNITNNRFYGNSSGVSLSSVTSPIIIEYNTFVLNPSSSTSQYIGLVGATSAIIRHNVMNCGNASRCMYVNGNNNIIYNNTVNGNLVALTLTGSWNNISYNNFTSNVYGMLISGGAYNTVYNNYISGLSIPALVTSITSYNIFNTTKTLGTNIFGGPYIGGNYYANSSNKGYSQTCSKTDGICNNAYSIDLMSLAGINPDVPYTDYLPLGNPPTPPQINYSIVLPIGTIRFLNCSPDFENPLSLPQGQSVSQNSINASNIGDTTGNLQIRVTSTPATGWTLYATNQSDLSQNMTLSTSWQTIYGSVSDQVYRRIWLFANCSYISSNPRASVEMRAV